MGSPERFRSRRPSWSLALLLVSIAAIGAAAVQAYRTVRSRQAMAESVLRDYARFAAWSYREHVIAELGSVLRESLGPVNHGSSLHTSPDVPHADDLGHYLPWDENCQCHVSRLGLVPSRFLGFTLGSDTLGLGRNHYPDPTRGWLADEPGHVDEAMPMRDRAHERAGPADAWINDTITRSTRSGHRPATGFDFIVARRHGRLWFLAYTLMPTVRGDTLVYIAEYDREAVARLLSHEFDQESILPAMFTRQRSIRELLALRVTAPDGTVLLDRTGPAWRWHLDTGLDLPPGYGALCVRAQIRPEMASAVIIGGLPASRLPYLLGLLVLAGALSIVAAAQLRRQAELARMREDFVASVSHELRTPLSQIRLFVETLRLGRADTEATRRWSLDRIDRETRRLSQLVDNVLRFAGRGRSPTLEPRERLELEAELALIVEEFAPLAESRRARVSLVVEGGAVVLASRSGLRQVLLNLLDNAVKYGPEGQHVVVRLSAVAPFARIAVEDEGPGVPAEERRAIWEPFRRGGSRAVWAVGGSGIGLTLVREIVEDHGGLATVEEATGGGSVFAILLPTVEGAADVAAGAAQVQVAGASAGAGPAAEHAPAQVASLRAPTPAERRPAAPAPGRA